MDGNAGNTEPPDLFEPSSSAERQGDDEEWKEEPETTGYGFEPERGSFVWWFGIDGKPSFTRRSAFRKLVVGITLFVCIIWMVSQTVCSSGPM